MILSSLTLLLLIVGCGPAPSGPADEEEAPPDPPDITNVAGQAIAGRAYAAGGECYTDEQLENLFASDPELQGFQIGATESRVEDLLYSVYSGLKPVRGTHANITARGNQWVYGRAYVLKNCDEWIPFDLRPLLRNSIGFSVNGEMLSITIEPHFFRDTNWITIDGPNWRLLEDNKEEIRRQRFFSGLDVPLAASLLRDWGMFLSIDDSWEVDKPQYVATYSCNRDVEGFDCHDGKWILGEFTVGGWTPPLSQIHLLDGQPFRLTAWQRNLNRPGYFSIRSGSLDEVSIGGGKQVFSISQLLVDDISNLEVWRDATNSKLLAKNVNGYTLRLVVPSPEGPGRGMIVCPDANTLDDISPACPNAIVYSSEACVAGDNNRACQWQLLGLSNSFSVTITANSNTVGVGLGPDPCANGVQDGDETDVDCGGPVCGDTCGDGDACNVDADCASNICEEGACLELPEVAAPPAVE